MDDKHTNQQHTEREDSAVIHRLAQLRAASSAKPTAEQWNRMQDGIASGLAAGTSSVIKSTQTRDRRRSKARRVRIANTSAAAAAILVVGIGAYVWTSHRAGVDQNSQRKVVASDLGPGNRLLSGGQGPLTLFNAKEGWVIAPTGNVLYTHDGGKTFATRLSLSKSSTQPITTSANQPDVRGDFLSPTNGFITAPGHRGSQLDIWHVTANGGRVSVSATHLTPNVSKGTLDQGSPDGVNAAQVVSGTVDFVNVSHGFLLLSWMGALGVTGQTLYASTDGGGQWHEVVHSLSSFGLHSSVPKGHRILQITGIAFENATDGWMTSTMFPRDKTTVSAGAVYTPPLLHTTDGGSQWSFVRLPVPSGDGKAVFGDTYPPQFFGQHHRDGVLLAGISSPETRVIPYVTHDGGAHWQATKGFTADIPGLTHLSLGASPKPTYSLLNSTDWWVLSADGRTLYHTDNAGKTWHSMQTNTNLKNAVLQFVDSKQGFALANGVLWKTSDAGASWTQVSRV